MANLLPHEEKERIRKIYQSRLFIVALFSLFIVISTGVIALIPPFAWGFVKEGDAKKRLSIISEIISLEERKNIRDAVERVNKKADLLFAGDEISLLAPAIEQIAARAGGNVVITGFFYDISAGGTSKTTLAVSGTSLDRRSLLSFVDNLREDKAFSDIDVPVSNFVKSSDIPFTILVSFNQISHAAE